MAEGFVVSTESPQRRARTYLSPQCGACGLLKTCKSPKMPLDGNGAKGIFVAGEAPGGQEDQQNRPFVGKTGQLLAQELRRLGIDFREDCWIYNAIVCRPTKDGRDRTPTNREIAYCRPNIVARVKELAPEKILLFGKSAVASLVGTTWREDLGGVGRWLGWKIPDRKLNAWVCPAWHPSFVSRALEERRDGDLVLLLWRKQLKEAVNLVGRPWPGGAPDLAKNVEVCLDTDRAAQVVRRVMELGGPVAFDFETNMLKPDSADARIHSCSIAWKGEGQDRPCAVAFPWSGKVVKVFGEFLRSDQPKVGWNLQFEERWAMKEFGRPVRNWGEVADGMLAAHVLDNRSYVTGLKFQAYVRLGVAPYDDYVEPFLKSVRPGSNSPNRIWEADLRKVLQYCGTDSLLEYMMWEIQSKEVGE